ncbi:DUF3093 family protein [Sciscionella marina]|uniref:DUF3093 family protein n=1 Tax=Sciscionella marina TaxID=508770 RepID=UPI0003A49494|nr:DUF3093 family protein [Sciscionella marina]
MAEPHYEHPGARWWPVSFGPGFAAAGLLLELLTGPVNVWLWLIVAAVLAGCIALWVRARRAVCSVRLTAEELRIGSETLAVERIRAVDEVDVPDGARVLGGLWAVPKRFAEVPLLLEDGTVVLAWAREGDRLRDALRALVPH